MKYKIISENFAPQNIKHAFLTKNIAATHKYVLKTAPDIDEADQEIERNHKVALDVFGEKAERINVCRQIHSNKVAVIEEDFILHHEPQMDAIVTNKPGIVLGVLTADCVPVLLADDEKKIIAVAHAGWRGALTNIVANTYSEMVKLGATNISASIGPCIHQESYEVGEEFFAEFCSADKKNEIFFISSQKENHYKFDLMSFVISKLKDLGIKKIFNTNINTYTDKENCFSYRRYTHDNNDKYGSLISLISIKQ